MKNLILFSFIFIVFTKEVAAQELKGFSISPPFQEVIINEGETSKKIEIEISNNTDKQELFKISAIDFGGMDETGGLALLGINNKDERKYGLVSWISLEKDSIILDPNTSRKLKIEIQNKDSLSPGGHYGAIMITLDSQIDKSGRIVGLNQSYASLLFLKKNGGEKYGIELNKIESKSGLFKLDKEIRLRFHNTGTVHVVPRGTIEIKDMFNRVVQKGVINYESSFLLPETFREMKVELQRQKKFILPGKYKIIVNYRFDGKNDYVLSENSFFYLTKPVLIILLVIFGVILGKFWIKKKRL